MFLYVFIIVYLVRLMILVRSTFWSTKPNKSTFLNPRRAYCLQIKKDQRKSRMQLQLGAGEKVSSSVIVSFGRSLLLETAFQGKKLCLPSILGSNQIQSAKFKIHLLVEWQRAPRNKGQPSLSFDITVRDLMPLTCADSKHDYLTLLFFSLTGLYNIW